MQVCVLLAASFTDVLYYYFIVSNQSLSKLTVSALCLKKNSVLFWESKMKQLQYFGTQNKLG